MKNKGFTLTKRIKSFAYAFEGFESLIKEESNFKIHIFFSIFVIIISLYFGLSVLEWIIIIFSIGLVLIVESLNTCIENICDFICIEKNEKIKKIKDIAAFSVVLSAIISIVIGFLIFIPKIKILPH
jgi:diacylglycerol kinase